MTRADADEMRVNENILNDEKYKYLFSVEAVNELVNKGIPFREAYKQVGNDIEKGNFKFDHTKQLHHTHEGSIGNLCNEQIVEEMKKVLKKFMLTRIRPLIFMIVIIIIIIQNQWSYLVLS